MSKFKSYKYRADKKGILFDIPELVFNHLTKQECYYCKTTEGDRGVDRINNKLGYESGNCVSSCWNCNRAKSDMDAGDFVEYLKRFNKELTIRHNPSTVHWDEGFVEVRADIWDRDVPSDNILAFMKEITKKKNSYLASKALVKK